MRPYLWCIGLTKIKNTKLRINDVIGSYKPTRDVSGTAPLVVSNHVSWFDMFFYLMYNVSFLAKADISTTPVIKLFANLRQCLYLERQSEENRNKTMKMITDRTQRIKSHNDIPPLLIFPEGTVTNGRSLISFKKGAFVTGDPIKIYVIKYNPEPLSYIWSISNINTLFSVLFCLSQFWNTIELIEYEDNFDPNWVYQSKSLDKTQDAAWIEVAATVKHLMAFAGNFHVEEASTRDLNTLRDLSRGHNAAMLLDDAKRR
jgi:1-acyl-sn-glycerol-3-phosphate acyltransferase